MFTVAETKRNIIEIVLSATVAGGVVFVVFYFLFFVYYLFFHYYYYYQFECLFCIYVLVEVGNDRTHLCVACLFASFLFVFCGPVNEKNIQVLLYLKQ